MARTFVVTWDTGDLRYEGGLAAFVQYIYAGRAHTMEWIVKELSIKKNVIFYLLRLRDSC